MKHLLVLLLLLTVFLVQCGQPEQIRMDLSPDVFEADPGTWIKTEEVRVPTGEFVHCHIFFSKCDVAVNGYWEDPVTHAITHFCPDDLSTHRVMIRYYRRPNTTADPYRADMVDYNTGLEWNIFNIDVYGGGTGDSTTAGLTRLRRVE